MTKLLIRPDQLADLALGEFGFAWNRLSPFADELSAAEGGRTTPVRVPPGLPDRAVLESALHVLVAPHVRITHRLAGPRDGPIAFTACLRRGPRDRVTVVAPGPNGAVELHVLDNLHAYLASWIGIVARRSGPDSTDYFPQYPLPELLCALHATDMYRRAKRLHEASFESADELAIDAVEFGETLSKSAEAGNRRWLLPTFLKLTPGIEEWHVGSGLDDLRGLVRRGILTLRQGNGGRLGFTFGAVGERLGEEFLPGISSAVGFEVALWSPLGSLPWCRGFLAPTAVSNHLIEVTPSRSGVAGADHHVLTDHQLMARLTAVVTSALHPEAPSRAVAFATAMAVMAPSRAAPVTPATPTPRAAPRAPSPPSEPASEAPRPEPSPEPRQQAPPRPEPKATEPAPRFCPSCGTLITPGKQFCRKCGRDMTTGKRPAAPAPQPTPPPAAQPAQQAPVASHAAVPATVAASQPGTGAKVGKGILRVVVPIISLVVTYYLTNKLFGTQLVAQFGDLGKQLVPLLISMAVGGIARALLK